MLDINRQIGERIRMARERARLSQAELGRRVGLSGAAIGYIENGLRKIKLEDLGPLARALGCSIEYLLAGTLAPPDGSRRDFQVVLMRATRFLNPTARAQIEEVVEEIKRLPPQSEPPYPPTPGVKPSRLLKELGIEDPPVDLEEVANRLGLHLRRHNLDDSVSALLIMDGEHRAIVVNRNHAAVRQRFSVSHEIGHYWLGHYEDVNIDHFDPVSGDSNSDPVLERQANQFAAELLMPEEWVRRDVTRLGLDPDRLAAHYGVSTQAMWIRLVELGLATPAFI